MGTMTNLQNWVLLALAALFLLQAWRQFVARGRAVGLWS